MIFADGTHTFSNFDIILSLIFNLYFMLTIYWWLFNQLFIFVGQGVGKGSSRTCVKKLTEKKLDLPRNLATGRNQTA